MKHPASPTIPLATMACPCGAAAVAIDPGELDEVSAAAGILLRRGAVENFGVHKEL
jgi:hypothetical protein